MSGGRPITRLVVRLSLPPDIRERHLIVARLANRPSTVVDVGGHAGQLALFVRAEKITAVNVVPPADLLYDGETLPLDDRSFSLATSIDVLEHLPRNKRLDHIRELMRVAREQVIVCCPVGTDAHRQAERDLADWCAKVTGKRNRYLDEHIELGLPTASELKQIASAVSSDVDLLFQGDFRRAAKLFRAAIQARRRPTPRALFRYGIQHLFSTPDLRLYATPPPCVNRAFLVLKHVGQAGVGQPDVRSMRRRTRSLKVRAE
jgi:hypothetical protein